MIASSAVVSTVRILLLSLLLTGCAHLPVYNPILPPLPSAALQADTVAMMPDGVGLPVREWLPQGRPRAVILALHGFDDSRDAWEYSAPVFTAAGVAVIAPDQRGFGAAPVRGRWPGTQQLVDDAASMLAWVRSRYPRVPLYAMGESMGGAVLMDLAARPDAPKISGWILLSPAVWGRRELGVVLSSGLWLVANTLPGLTVTGGEVRLRVTASDNREALLRLARDPLTIRHTRFDTLAGLVNLMDSAQAAAAHLPSNTLALYGEKDMIVPVDAAARAWAHMPATVRLGLYPSGYHLLLRDHGRMSVIQDILSWMADPAATLPSGADRWARLWLHWRELGEAREARYDGE